MVRFFVFQLAQYTNGAYIDMSNGSDGGCSFIVVAFFVTLMIGGAIGGIQGYMESSIPDPGGWGGINIVLFLVIVALAGIIAIRTFFGD